MGVRRFAATVDFFTGKGLSGYRPRMLVKWLQRAQQGKRI